MATTPPRAGHRLQPTPGLAAAIVTVLALLALAKLSLLTPAFSDYDVEIGPAVDALLAGQVGDGLRLLPIYGGAVLVAFPLAWLTDLLGGGSLATYRAMAVPGAIGVGLLAVLAARWMREEGAGSRLPLVAAGLIALSPCVALAWNIGHPEEPLVASAGLAGLLLVARGGGSGAVIGGGVLLGLAAAGKAWAVLLLPVALVSTRTGRDAARVVVASGVAGVLLLLPVALPRLEAFGDTLAATGSAISSPGNLWWFLGRPNPDYVPPGTQEGSTIQLFTTSNSARISPEFIAAHSHELIVALAAVLSAVWWWRVGRAQPAQARRERIASVLLLAAAVLWWRAVADPWFQAYYLTPALMAVVLADSRLGRLPAAGLVAWGAIWLIHGQNAPDMGLDADATSALRLAWLVPVGLWITTRALRPVRGRTPRVAA